MTDRRSFITSCAAVVGLFLLPRKLFLSGIQPIIDGIGL